MKLGGAIALTVTFVVCAVFSPRTSAQELFGVHFVVVDEPGSPVKITEFVFGKGNNWWRGPNILVANHSKKEVAAYTLAVDYLASKGCNVLGSPNARYDFLTIERINAAGFARGIQPGASAEQIVNIKPEEPFSFLTGDQSAHFPLNLNTAYLHVQVRVIGVHFADGTSWQRPVPEPGSDPEKYAYDHATYDGDRVDCNHWMPVMNRLNENMRWTDVMVESPKKLEQLGAGLVESSHSGSAEFLYTCAFTQSPQFTKVPKRAAFVCPDLSK